MSKCRCRFDIESTNILPALLIAQALTIHAEILTQIDFEESAVTAEKKDTTTLRKYYIRLSIHK